LSATCKKDVTDLKIIDCTLENSIDILPDSTFISDALKMQITENYIYFIEKTSRQVIKLNTDFNKNTRIGTWGIGPQDLTEPKNYFLIDDTLYIMDTGSMSIKCFSPDYTYLHSFNVKAVSEQRIFTKNGILYMASYNKDSGTCLVRLYFTDKKEEMVMESFGQPFDFNHSLQNIIRNKRDLLKGNEYFYAVSDNQPIIEKYNYKNGNRPELFDYSFVPIIRENMKFINSKPYNPNSYTAFVRDSYIHKEALYLLISKQGDKFTANTVLRIDLEPNLNINTIYRLPGEIYSTFCVDDNSFYAFNSETASLEKIRREQ